MAKKVSFSILTTFVTVTLVSAVLYGYEFFFNPYIGMPQNGYIGNELYTWGHLVKNNQYGFRERNFDSPKPAGMYRIMVLGDSLTWGAGLAPEERYTAITENLLNKTFNDRKFEVLNFGISGGPTIRERDILRQYKDIVNPDLIVVGFCLNDPQPRGQDYSVERENLEKSQWGAVVARMQVFLRYIRLPYLSERLNVAFYNLAMKAGIMPDWQTALQRTYDPSSDEWVDFVRALRDIKNISDELHLPSPIFAILNQGNHSSDYNNLGGLEQAWQGTAGYAVGQELAGDLKHFLTWYHQAEKAAKDVGFMTYNHEYEIPRQIKNESLRVNRLDYHPSASLNRVYGEKLYQKITEVIQNPPTLPDATHVESRFIPSL